MQENNQDLTQEKMQDEIKSAIERMQEEMREKENLTLLGNHKTEYRMDYDPSVLDA